MADLKETKEVRRSMEKLLARIIPELTQYFRTIEDCRECQSRLKASSITGEVIVPKTDCVRNAHKLAEEKRNEYIRLKREDEEQQIKVE